LESEILVKNLVIYKTKLIKNPLRRASELEMGRHQFGSQSFKVVVGNEGRRTFIGK